METKGGNGRLDQDLIDICFGIGLSVKTTAWVVRDSVDRVWHEWSVRTGLPTPHDPISSVIQQRAKEVQAGWTEEQRQLAQFGCTARPSSKTVEYRQRQRQEVHQRWKATKKAKEQECRSGLIEEKASQSPSPVIVHQMTLWSLSTASEATACG
jgi:hypothetical protein